jgi:hypothetical protein
VLVTCSSEFQNDGRLAEAALAAFADRDITVAVTTAGVDPAALRTPPAPNAHVARFWPHSALLARAACVICHAGMGITQKALTAGVPVCAVPFGRDQFEVARRVQVARAGAMLPASRLRPGRLRAAAEEAMTCTAGAARIAAAFPAAAGSRHPVPPRKGHAMTVTGFDVAAYKSGQERDWAATAEGWREQHWVSERQWQQVSAGLLGRARVRPGSRVLDVATGIGEPALAAAALAGLGGRVVGTDLSAVMIAIAAGRARARGTHFDMTRVEVLLRRAI